MSISPATVQFMAELADNNNREWFNANKKRYEQDVKEASLAFIREFGEVLPTIAPHVEAIAKVQGGSLFRIYRDTRFSKDKTPYKTNVAMHFRHSHTSKDVHGPGFYLHFGPQGATLGAGMWGPAKDDLKALRDAICADATAWSEAWDETAASGWDWYGDNALKRAPKGYDPEHEHIETLKRKSFAITRPIDLKDVYKAGFATRLAGYYAETSPLMAFECEAIGVPY